MGRPLIQMPSGGRAIGRIEEENGIGSRAVGRDLQGLTPIGYPVIGSQGGEAGPGSMATGNTDKSSE